MVKNNVEVCIRDSIRLSGKAGKDQTAEVGQEAKSDEAGYAGPRIQGSEASIVGKQEPTKDNNNKGDIDKNNNDQEAKPGGLEFKYS